MRTCLAEQPYSTHSLPALREWMSKLACDETPSGPHAGDEHTGAALVDDQAVERARRIAEWEEIEADKVRLTCFAANKAGLSGMFTAPDVQSEHNPSIKLIVSDGDPPTRFDVSAHLAVWAPSGARWSPAGALLAPHSRGGHSLSEDIQQYQLRRCSSCRQNPQMRATSVWRGW